MGTRAASNIIRQSICLILLVSRYTHASQESPADCSCKCQHDQLIGKDPSVPSTLCENDNFVKCCSAFEPLSMAIETTTSHQIQDHSSEMPESRTQFEVDLISRVMQKIFSMMRPSEESTEVAVAEVQPGRDQEVAEQETKNEEEEVQGGPVRPIEIDVGRNILKNVEDIMSFMNRNKDASSSPKEPKSIPLMREPHPIRVRILSNHLPSKMTGVPAGFSLPGHMGHAVQRIHHQREDKGIPSIITYDEESEATIEHQEPLDDIQKLIEETSSFESRKVLPKIHPGGQAHRWRTLRKRNNFQPPADSRKASSSGEEELESTKLIGCHESERGGSSYALPEHGSPEEESDARSTRTPKKVADLFRQKTSLETLLALDRASVQAADGNAPNSASKLDTSEDSEAPPNSPRLGRSRLTTAENRGEIQQPIEENNDQTPVSRFKRPPRVLPKRIQPVENSQAASNKYRNSRERTLDLFNRSDESKSRAALIIKRRERNMSRLFSSSASPEIENESSFKKSDEADVSDGGNGDRRGVE